MLSLTSPVETPYHRLPAAAKLAALSAATFGLFLTDDPRLLTAALAGTVALYALAGPRFLWGGLRALRPLWPFVAVVLVWHGWAGEMLLGLAICLRMGTAVALATLVTMTTRLEDMTDVVTWLARPLAALGLSPRLLGFAIALVIRFTPVLLDRARGLIDAWRARSARRAGWRIVLPLTLLALDDAEHVAEALRARGGLDR